MVLWTVNFTSFASKIYCLFLSVNLVFIAMNIHMSKFTTMRKNKFTARSRVILGTINKLAHHLLSYSFVCICKLPKDYQNEIKRITKVLKGHGDFQKKKKP